LRLEEQLDADELARAAHAGGVTDNDDVEAGDAAQRTVESLKDTERLADALRLADSEVAARAAARRASNDDNDNAAKNDDDDEHNNNRDTSAPTVTHIDADRLDDDAAECARTQLAQQGANPLLLGLTPSNYVLRCVRAVPAARMDAVLLALPFDVVVSLLRYVHSWLRTGVAVELAARLAVFVVRINLSTLSHSARLRPLLDALAHHSAVQLRHFQDELGYNEAALSFMQRQLELRHINVFEGTNQKLREVRRKAKVARAKITL
jgi:hypothetical protein